MTRFRLSTTSLLAFCAGLVPLRTPAAGFYLYEYGSPSVGLASAGYAARASDAETPFTNPAGGTLSVDQSRGPLAGTVAGEYRGAFTNMLALNLRWLAR